MNDRYNNIPEHSPLITHDRSSSEDELSEAIITPRSTSYLFLSSLGLGGLQIAWAIKYAGLLFYLLSLEIPKSTISLVWVFSPLIGAFIQCYVGMRSDACRFQYGRRKPFLIAGIGVMAVLFLGLSWAQELVGFVFGDGRENVLAVWALVCVGSLDMVMNIVEASIRAYIMDVNLSTQQNAASAMAGVMLSVGNILGYVLGGFHLVEIVPWFEYHNAQFKLLSFAAIVAVTATVTISLLNIAEPNPQERFSNAGKEGLSIVSYIASLPSLIRSLPSDIRRVCQVQILVWTGWFAFLFYSTTWIGEIWIEPFLQLNPHMDEAELDALYGQASKVGNSAFILWSSSALFWGLVILWMTNTKRGIALLANKDTVEVAVGTSTKVVRRIWMVALAVLACFLISSLFIGSVTLAMLGMIAAGLPWAATMWAPFAIISNSISKRSIKTLSQPVHADAPARMSRNVDAGMALGINALAMAVAQVTGSVISAPIFHSFQVERGMPGDRSISTSFFVLGWFVAGGVYMVASPWESDKRQSSCEVENI